MFVKLFILIILLPTMAAVGRPVTTPAFLQEFVHRLEHSPIVNLGNSKQLRKMLNIRTAGLAQPLIGSALLVAAEEGYTNAITKLLPFSDHNHLDLVLTKAAKAGQLEVVTLAVERGATARWSALQHAATAGHLEVVAWLVREADTDPSASDVLQQAAAAGQLQIVQWLIREAHVKGSNWALLAATAADQLEVVRWLVTEGRVTNIDGALRCAIEKDCSVELQQLLLELGAD